MSVTIRKRIVVFSSHGSGNFQTVLDTCLAYRADDLKVVYLVTDRTGIPSIDLAERHGIPWDAYTFPSAGIDAGEAARQRQNACDLIFERLLDIERSEGIDLIVSAFRRILCGRLVSYFDKRIINVHPADLTVFDPLRRTRRYVGIAGFRRSIADGNHATRTTVHYLDAGVDTGDIVCVGPWVEVDRTGPVDVACHEKRQKLLSDAPALTAALEHLLLRRPIPKHMVPPMCDQQEQSMETIQACSAINKIIRGNNLTTDDFIEWSRRTQSTLKKIRAEGPDFLGQLVQRAFDNPSLRHRHETHQLLDYIVLYEDPESGIRLRLHIATAEHLQRMHDHRFSFSTLIFNGHYQHCLYSATEDPYLISARDRAIHHQDRLHPDPAFAGHTATSLFHLDWIRGERQGSCYSLHHSQIHTVYTSKNTISLVLRGPIQKERSMIFDQLENAMWWRFGRQDESAQRVSTKIMTDEKFADVQAHLTRLGVIA